MKKCSDCKHRAFGGMFGIEYCIGYEMAETEANEIESAKNCQEYDEGKPSCYDDDEYCPSATGGDYGPGNPWDAPGMSIKDFI